MQKFIKIRQVSNKTTFKVNRDRILVFIFTQHFCEKKKVFRKKLQYNFKRYLENLQKVQIADQVCNCERIIILFQQFFLNPENLKMKQISFVNAFNINPFKNQLIKKNYQQHKQKITQISKKSLGLTNLQVQQQKLLQSAHKSKEIARRFQQKEFQLRRNSENKRLAQYLSTLNSKRHSSIQDFQQSLILKARQGRKETVTKQRQIKMQNKSLGTHLQSYIVSKKVLKSKIQGQITEYLKLREHMQKFKNTHTNISRMSSRSKDTVRLKKISPRRPQLLLNDQLGGQYSLKKLRKSSSLPPLSPNLH